MASNTSSPLGEKLRAGTWGVMEFMMATAEDKVDMVDISGKKATYRCAVARARVLVSDKVYASIRDGNLLKGNALAVAKVAGIQAAKRTAELIPLCHQLPLAHVQLTTKMIARPKGVEITARASANYATGVEMEALVAVTIAALTIYDMTKAIDKGTTIEKIELLEKSGGKSGNWKK